MKTLKIGLGTPTAWFVPIAWAIRLLEWTCYNHMFFQYETENGEQVFDTTIAGGTQETPIAEFNARYNTIKLFEFKLTDLEFEAFRQFCNSCKGKPYGLKQLFGLVLVKLFFLKHNPLSEGPDEFTCSELLLLAMRAIPSAFPNPPKENPDTVGLRVLESYLEEHASAIIPK